ncbi:MAG: hypothetical protein RQ899_02015 [Pseudomonadales bacterium]|nr:hypothetical protein [Pseudomonadales bacterium]
MDFLSWLENSAPAIYIREDLWGYPITLSSHGIGMAIVVGVVVAVNMRVLGFAPGIPVHSLQKLFPIAWGGFFLNLVSGLALYAAGAVAYTFQGAFQLKLGLIVLGGILMKVLMTGIREGKSEGMIKLISIACLLSWFGAVVTGRLMAYLA